MKSTAALAALLGGLALLPLAPPAAAEETAPEAAGAAEALQLLSGDPADREEAVRRIGKDWQEGFVPMVLEVARLVRDHDLRAQLLRLLEMKTGQRHGQDFDLWWKWLWNRELAPHPEYPEFKAALYGLIDPRFRGYFSSRRTARIRLDEVRWGGVVQDGIPPLRSPKMISARQADYLDDGDVVFALEIRGEARAYPQRIMGWHEMFVDTVGGIPVAGVYCTLCGSMILYETVHDGVEHHLGTSGFLYRSNKLMYDRDTQSLWNTLWGQPVIGPLADRDITLKRRSVVTTTWGEWRRRHPDTRVLSLDTGHQRDYSEGAAYRDYFATDELMFEVPKLDRRLKNKAEVLSLLLATPPGEPLAIAARYLSQHPLYHDRAGGLPFVVLTDRSGANRVYETRGLRFVEWDRDRTVVDENGTAWTLSEERLESAAGALARLPAHRAFWFGWYSAYPSTRLVH
jgi:hypothetical protein